MTSLVPPNLAALGVPRQTPDGTADLETIWRTPYPVIGNYEKFCRDAALAAFGGGTRQKQGARIPGYITSGYRDATIDNNTLSPHKFAFALDIIIGPLQAQLRCAEIAKRYFSRIGLYPEQGFIHVDLAPDNWVEQYGKAWSWVKTDGVYHTFNNLRGAILWSLEWQHRN